MTATGRCCFCHQLMFPAGSRQVRADPFCQQTREHMIPQSINRARLNVRANLKPSCAGCNDLKGTAPWQIYAWFVRQPGVLQLDRAKRRQQFASFVYACALAGFTAAKRDVMGRRPKPNGMVASAFAAVPPDDDEPLWMRGKTRGTGGRFVAARPGMLHPETVAAANPLMRSILNGEHRP